VKEGKDAGQAYAESPGDGLVKFSSKQDELSYECSTTKHASCSIALNGDSHWIYEIPSGTRYEYDTETGYTAGGSYPDYTGMFTGDAFNMTWNYERYGARFWGAVLVILDALPEEATRVVSFRANRWIEGSTGEMATLNQNFEGVNIPLTLRADYGIYFEINGADVCNHVTAQGNEEAHRSDGLHRYSYSGIGCNSKGRLYIGFDFLD